MPQDDRVVAVRADGDPLAGSYSTGDPATPIGAVGQMPFQEAAVLARRRSLALQQHQGRLSRVRSKM